MTMASEGRSSRRTSSRQLASACNTSIARWASGGLGRMVISQLVFLWMVAVALVRTSEAAQNSGDCVVSSSCLALLSMQSQTQPALTSSFSNYTAAILKCVGYQGVALRPIRVLAPTEATDLANLIGPMFKRTTGFEVIFEFTDALTLGDRILDSATGKGVYDGIVTGTRWLVEMAEQGFLEPLDSYINNDPALDWADMHTYISKSNLMYNGSTIGLPMTIQPPVLYYRSDALANAKLQPPTTWQDLLSAVKMLNGTDINKDGKPDYGLCWQYDQDCLEKDWLIGAILASMTQTNGTSSGWLFNLNTMEPLVNTAAYTATLELVQQLLPYSTNLSEKPAPSTSACVATSFAFETGRCAFVMKFASQFQALRMETPAKASINIAPTPGSTVVLDTSGRLVPCTATLCPYATLETVQDGSKVLVNRAPYYGYGAMGYVNAYSPVDYKKASYQLLSLMAGPAISTQLMWLPPGTSPNRKSQTTITNSTLLKWAALGYNSAKVSKYLTIMGTTLEHRNNALDLRIHGGENYRNAFRTSLVMLLNGSSVASVQADTMSRFGAIAAEFTAAASANGYYSGLNAPAEDGSGGIRRYRAPDPPPAPVSPSPSPTQAAAPTSEADTISLKTVMALVFGLVVPVLIALALVMVWISGPGRFKVFGLRATPGVSPNTTLMVTDIENSTLLWESLEQETMNHALELHHCLARRLLNKRSHMGYESATEGDSFIMAFHTAQAALAFAQAFQAGLLQLDWPREVLDSPLARPLWAKAQPGTTTLPRGKSQTHSSWISSSVSFWKLPTAGTADTDMLATTPKEKDGLQLPRERTTFNRTSPTVAPTNNMLKNTTHTVASFLGTQWTECTPPANGQADPSVWLVYRGLRVRCGLHSGVYNAQDVMLNKTTGRRQYTGRPLSIAKAVGDCGHGGMIMASEGCFEQLPLHKLEKFGMLIHMGDVVLQKDKELPPMSLYQVVAHSMKPRLAFMDTRLRAVQQLQVGALEAPIGSACIAFANLVGAGVLLAWDREKAGNALNLYHQRAVGLMGQTPGVDGAKSGYVVELTGGLCLAAFHNSATAIMWGLKLIDDLLEAPWEPELLQHELCEEVLIRTHRNSMDQEGGLSHTARRAASNHPARILFRGPRLKIGIDAGTLHAGVNPTTGRVAYRGRVMNRASRIAEKAGSSQLWCSAAAWIQCQSHTDAVEGQDLGTFVLKGVNGEVNLVQCQITRMLDAHPLGPREPSANRQDGSHGPSSATIVARYASSGGIAMLPSFTRPRSSQRMPNQNGSFVLTPDNPMRATLSILTTPSVNSARTSHSKGQATLTSPHGMASTSSVKAPSVAPTTVAKDGDDPFDSYPQSDNHNKAPNERNSGFGGEATSERHSAILQSCDSAIDIGGRPSVTRVSAPQVHLTRSGHVEPAPQSHPQQGPASQQRKTPRGHARSRSALGMPGHSADHGQEHPEGGEIVDFSDLLIGVHEPPAQHNQPAAQVPRPKPKADKKRRHFSQVMYSTEIASATGGLMNEDDETVGTFVL